METRPPSPIGSPQGAPPWPPRRRCTHGRAEGTPPPPTIAARPDDRLWPPLRTPERPAARTLVALAI
eukprot:CAMPEP_0194301968 /NCGR_PEP_ID=MMETSP0169-20130528/62083_1 /TAXON_ID=218684 /ORGANISM="Corethron pennatum, Strain L29A3" /LENGTH=66 /DNA_ID=CAMNT_0039052259 /DNA_START=219 /DNA_END=419 /DNA_ORIENTATION=-